MLRAALQLRPLAMWCSVDQVRTTTAQWHAPGIVVLLAVPHTDACYKSHAVLLSVPKNSVPKNSSTPTFSINSVAGITVCVANEGAIAVYPARTAANDG
jgi:hypothetical protein